ncbi:ABC transporter substrate-binding protein [Acetobacterium sp.]|uniref:ABC transporter substrate-binding protein n=1 Tax=Acetobacterium sp. TaxID=1872094 RepID=UPI003593E5D1
MHKKTSLLLCCLLMVTLLMAISSGCQNQNPTAAVPTKTIVDCLNREVVIPADPQRVACLYASTAHIMAMLGQEAKIVGIPNGIKRDVLMAYKRSDIGAISVPFNDGAINIEELLATNTDLVLLRQSTAENAGEIEKLNKAGIPWVVIDYASLEGLQKAITITGQVFNQDERAAGYNAFLQQTLTLISQRVSGLPESARPRVYHAVNEAARTDRAGDLCSQITAAAGIINVSTQGGSLITDAEKTMTTLEQIYSWNPDAIIANDINASKYMLTDPKWSGLKAVAEHRVTTLPVGVTRWGHPGSMEPHMAALFIATTFYPDLFGDVDLTQTVKDYYQQWFDLNLSDADVAAILSGEGMRLAK